MLQHNITVMLKHNLLSVPTPAIVVPSVVCLIEAAVGQPGDRRSVEPSPLTTSSCFSESILPVR